VVFAPNALITFCPAEKFGRRNTVVVNIVHFAAKIPGYAYALVTENVVIVVVVVVVVFDEFLSVVVVAASVKFSGRISEVIVAAPQCPMLCQ